MHYKTHGVNIALRFRLKVFFQPIHARRRRKMLFVGFQIRNQHFDGYVNVGLDRVPHEKKKKKKETRIRFSIEEVGEGW